MTFPKITSEISRLRLPRPLPALAIISAMSAMLLSSCFSSRRNDAIGGDVTGVGGINWTEPVPFGMVLVDRGAIRMGPAKDDSLADIKADPKGISVDAFWMDETEITNSEYKQFVFWVRDSIIRERLADPAFGGDETYKIEEDRDGNPITPRSSSIL